MLLEVGYDCRSVTGKNIRLMTLETEKCDGNVLIDEIPYSNIPEDAEWRLNLATEILAIKSGDLNLSNITHRDLDSILEEVCCHHQK